jgi:hypothetical protein
MQRERKVGRRRRRRFGNAVGIVNSRPRQRRRNSDAVDQRDAAVDASGDVADDQADGAADADFCGGNRGQGDLDDGWQEECQSQIPRSGTFVTSFSS